MSNHLWESRTHFFICLFLFGLVRGNERLLRLLDTYATAKICELKTLWPLIKLINHLFKIRQKTFTSLKSRSCKFLLFLKHRCLVTLNNENPRQSAYLLLFAYSKASAFQIYAGSALYMVVMQRVGWFPGKFIIGLWRRSSHFTKSLLTRMSSCHMSSALLLKWPSKLVP